MLSQLRKVYYPPVPFGELGTSWCLFIVRNQSMDACDLHLGQLIQSAMDECRRIQESAESNWPVWLFDSTNEAISAMTGYLESVRTSQLPRPSDGAGLGFSRGIGEWADGYEHLMALAYEIDRYYSENCNCVRVVS